MTREEHLNNLRNVVLMAIRRMEKPLLYDEAIRLEEILMMCLEHGFNAGEIYGLQHCPDFSELNSKFKENKNEN